MVYERGQNLLQLHEKSLARGVAVGVHVELNGTGTVPAVSSGANHRGTVPKVLQVLEHLLVFLREECGRGMAMALCPADRRLQQSLQPSAM